MMNGFLRISLLVLLLVSVVHLQAKPVALFVIGRAGSPELEQEIEHTSRELGAWYRKHRNAEVRICRTADALRKEFSRLTEEKNGGNTDLFLFGHASANGKRVTLSMKGGRLSAAELDTLLRKTPCKTVFLFNTMSAPFLDVLRKPGRILVSATDSNRQLNPPRYPLFFLQALKELGPEKPLTDSLSRAGDLTRQFYESHKLAITENSQYFDGQEKHSHPFRSTLPALARTVPEPKEGKTEKPPRPRAPRAVADSAIQPASEETRKRIADAQKLARRYADYPAFLVRRDISAILNPDQTARIRIADTFYFQTVSGCKRFAPANNPSAIPARLIDPDGRFQRIGRGPIPTPRPGSLLEITREQTLRPTGHLPDFHAVIPVQAPLPIASHTFRATGASERYRIRKYHLDKPELAPIPPGRPAVAPRARIVITTLPSWEEFLAWSRRMTDRAMTLDPDAQRFTDTLLQGARSEREKVRRIYNFLNDLRYVTIPLGAAAFRPRSASAVIRDRSGDCKDKASALAAMCARAGIRVERVLVQRGGTIDPDFPSWQFNHMLAYVPSLDLWLDATDGLTAFGDLPPGDHGTLGLSLDAPGIRFRTVKTARSAGLLKRTIRRNGSSLEIGTHCTGLFDYAFRRRRNTLLPETERNFFASILESTIPTAELKSWTVSAGESDGSTRYTLQALSPQKGETPLPAPDLPAELLRNFSAERISSPIRLFDGRDWEIILRLEFPGSKLSWKRESGPVRLRLESNDDATTLTLSGKGNSALTPEEYAAVRKDLQEMRRILRSIFSKGFPL